MPILICLLVEKGLAVEIITEGFGMFIHVINIVVLVLIPMVIIHVRGQIFSLSECIKIRSFLGDLFNNFFSTVGASFVCFAYSILFMKLWSYVQVNMWCRHDIVSPKSTKTRKRTQSISIAQLRKLFMDFYS